MNYIKQNSEEKKFINEDWEAFKINKAKIP